MALSLIPQFKHDVFLSFRGEDTRNNFISHLRKALRDKQIQTFIDDELRRGDEISPSLLKAIEESQISIIIFSKDYASSRWCLEELIKILECRQNHRQIVIPVFYEIDPSHVRHQTGSFAVAFAKHQQRPTMVSLDKVQRWKDALNEAANLSGFDSRVHKPESVLIEAIVQDVLERMNSWSSIDTGHLVGVDSKIVKIESMLSIGTNDVRSVGIWGIGGIGKTTLAETVFNKISYQFESSYFCRNVRERCEQSNGLDNLQQELLSALLGDGNANIGTFAVGRTFIRNRLGRKKLLIVFDDVSDYSKIEYLIGGPDCLGPQSRIIITARDKQELKQVDHVYEVQKLIHDEALDLFRRHAFERNQYPTEEYTELSNRVTGYAGGVPLALKVLGRYLLGLGKEDWKSAIDKLERIFPDKDMHKVLKISFDGLDDEVQKIFLDIACFFKWYDFEPVKSFLDACGFHTEIGIRILINRSLIAISYNMITMHDLLQAMAREIVRQESVDEPGNRSRLWHYEDICRVLTTNTGTKKIEGIYLDMSEISDIHLNPYAFTNMPRLRILKFFNSDFRELNKVHVYLSHETYFPELRYLTWHGCPIKSPLSSFYSENLIKLDMSYSKVEQLWNGCQPLVKLKEVDLSFSNLISCPDFSGSPNLKRLILQECIYLREISPSIQYLIKLDFLQLEGCCSLKGIPDCGGLNSLKELNLSWCSNLEMLPEMPCNIEELWLTGTAIEELPSSFGNLSRLQELFLDCCDRLKSLPSSICKWKSLQNLSIGYCSKLNELPNDIGPLESLEILKLERDPIRELPSSIKYLKNLWMINCRGCEELTLSGFEFFPDNLRSLILSESGITELPEFPNGCLSSLESLDLSGTSLESIPASIINLSGLSYLVISNCKRLKCLPKLPLGSIEAYGCTSLEVLPSPSLHLRMHIVANFINCFKLDQNIVEDIVEVALLNIKLLHMFRFFVGCKLTAHGGANLCYPGNEIPKWFNFRSMGSFINVELPPNWYNHNFIGFGFALCIATTPLLDGIQSSTETGETIEWKCNINSKDGQPCVRSGRFGMHAFSNHVLVECPIFPFSRSELLCYENEVSFEFCIYREYFTDTFEIYRHDAGYRKIEKCGVHLIFGQHRQHLEEVNGSSRVGEDEDFLCLANVPDNCEEVDEPQKKEGDTQLIKGSHEISESFTAKYMMVKAWCVQVADSVGHYFCVNCFGFGSVE